jgi:hypothetical protein
MENKRGQGLPVNAIILIILGVVLLVMLIIGFTLGWDKLAPWIGGDNVEDVVSSCGVACSTGGKYAYCTQERKLTDPEGNEYNKVTCQYLAEKKDKYGIAPCLSVGCDDLKVVDGETLKAVCQGKGVGDEVKYLKKDGQEFELVTEACTAEAIAP